MEVHPAWLVPLKSHKTHQSEAVERKQGYYRAVSQRSRWKNTDVQLIMTTGFKISHFNRTPPLVIVHCKLNRHQHENIVSAKWTRLTLTGAFEHGFFDEGQVTFANGIFQICFNR